MELSPTSAAAAANHALARFGLADKRALVTGGTKGIGKAVVEELASLGATVFTCSRNADELKAAVEAWHARGLAIAGVAADVSTPEGRERLLRECGESQRAGSPGDVEPARLDILVNNVGTNVKKPSVEYTKEDFDKVFGTNLESAVALTALAHPLHEARGGGQQEESARRCGGGGGGGPHFRFRPRGRA